jgi:hypothetical protein
VEGMNTKQKGDIAEQAAILQALKRGWGVLHPVGDRLPYDLVFDLGGSLVKIQVKTAWVDQGSGNYVMDTRRTKTNRRIMVRDSYGPADFDFALVYLAEIDVFYILPVDIFLGYKSGISLVETARRQRKPRSAGYRDAWGLIAEWAAAHVRRPGETNRETQVAPI